jgi:hypothetical protein
MGNNAAMQGTTRPRAAGAMPVPHRWGLLEKLVFGPATHSSTFFALGARAIKLPGVCFGG